MKAIILAAGKGSRLAKFTKGKPKCLLELNGETILSREIRLLKECGITENDIFIIGGYKHDLLKDIAPNLIINALYDVKDNSYSLGLALGIVDNDDVIVLDADLVFQKELLQEVISCTHKNLLLSKKSDDTEESTGIIEDKNNYVKAVGKHYQGTGFVYLSIFKIAKETIKDLKNSLLKEHNTLTWYTAAITDICSKHKFINKVTNLKWHEIDEIEDYYETMQIFDLKGD